jgi:glycosyltransferase involved in cell wall biosynthesis
MAGESVVYLAKEWGQEPTSCDHVFEQLARHNKVLWVNSIATRAPRLASARDWRRIFAKLRRCLGGLRQVRPSAWLYQPLFLPLPFSRTAQAINRRLLRWSLGRQCRKLGMHHPQLWMFQPNGAFLAGCLGESLVVYYCVDEWSEFGHLESEKIAALERELLERADICFAVSQPLLERKKRYNPRTFLALHGVDHERFAAALDARGPLPPDIASLPRPIIGFFGGLKEHIDFLLLEEIARRHPEWSLVLIGSVEADVERLRAYPNVHFLGRRANDALPDYCRGFSAGLIPYLSNEFIRHVNPIKLRQYLSAGLPVISTDMVEARRLADLIHIGRDHADFIAKVEQALSEDSPAKRRQRSEAMRGETWEIKVAQVCDRIMQVKAAKGQ